MSENMEVGQYVGYKLAKAIYKINALIPATSADSILQAAGIQLAVTSRFQNVSDRLSKSSIRLVRLCAIPDPSYIFKRENKEPKRYAKISGTRGQIELKEYGTGRIAYFSVGLADDGVPFSSGVPPIDLNPHIALTREERMLLLKSTLMALYRYEPDDDELKATDVYIYDSYRPYYEMLTEFLLHIPRELQDKLSSILKSGKEERSLNGNMMKELVYIFIRAMELGRYAMFNRAQKFLSEIRSRGKQKEFVSELFDRYGIIFVDEGIKGPGRRPPISNRGRKLIVDAAMYLTVFLSPYILRLRKTRMTAILREFALQHKEYFEITGDNLGENFLSRVLTEARSRRFRRICLMIRPEIEGYDMMTKDVKPYFVVTSLTGKYFKSFGFTDSSVALKRIFHEYFGSTSFIYERKEDQRSRIKFDMIYAGAALNKALPFDRYPPSIDHAQYLISNDYRIAQMTAPGLTKIYYAELTPETLFNMMTSISDAFLPKNDLYYMAKEFAKEYVASKASELESE